MKLCITGGGTGGHLMIAEALLAAAVSKGHEVIFIGSTYGQDRKYFETGSAFSHSYFLETTGVVNQKGFRKIGALWKILRGFLQARKLLKQHNVVATYSVGGFSAAPASFASLSTFIPLFIHEQNAVFGKLNKLLKPFATNFISAYDSTSQIQGYPVKEVFFNNAHLRKELGTIIFLGGSQGARAINNLALSIADELSKRHIKIIHQAGELDFARVQEIYTSLGVEVELYSFTKELPALINRADLAVSRSGASTLWELTANGCPAFYIPYPYAAGDHQFHNAAFIVENGMGWCEREGESLESKLLALLEEPLQTKSEKLLNYSRRDVALKMINDIEERVKNA